MILMHGYEKVFGEGGNPVIGMSIMDLKSFFHVVGVYLSTREN